MLNAALMQARSTCAVPPVDFLYSAWGVVLAEVTVYTPFVLRPLLAAFSLLDPAQIEVASILGARPCRIVRQVILPAALPALLAGGSLCLLLTVNEFGIVLFIGAKGVITLPLLIYDKAIQESDYQAACIIAVVNIALSLGPVRPLPVRRHPAGGSPCWSGLGPAGSPSGRSPALLLGVRLRRAAGRHPGAASPGQWNGVLPTGFTLGALRRRRLRRLGRSASGRAWSRRLSASLAGACVGTWAALALRGIAPRAAPASSAFCSSSRAPCRRSRSASACWSPSASRRCCSTARSRS